MKQLKTGQIILNTQFSKESIQVSSKHVKRCPILLTTRETQIQPTIYHHLPTKMTI